MAKFNYKWDIDKADYYHSELVKELVDLRLFEACKKLDVFDFDYMRVINYTKSKRVSLKAILRKGYKNLYESHPSFWNDVKNSLPNKFIIKHHYMNSEPTGGLDEQKLKHMTEPSIYAKENKSDLFIYKNSYYVDKMKTLLGNNGCTLQLERLKLSGINELTLTVNDVFYDLRTIPDNPHYTNFSWLLDKFMEYCEYHGIDPQRSFWAVFKAENQELTLNRKIHVYHKAMEKRKQEKSKTSISSVAQNPQRFDDNPCFQKNHYYYQCLLSSIRELGDEKTLQYLSRPKVLGLLNCDETIFKFLPEDNAGCEYTNIGNVLMCLMRRIKKKNETDYVRHWRGVYKSLSNHFVYLFESKKRSANKLQKAPDNWLEETKQLVDDIQRCESNKSTGGESPIQTQWYEKMHAMPIKLDPLLIQSDQG